ncbi:MAG: hypothetical protein PGN34_24600 [Methylobacterium frigidaeris]
MRLRTGAGLLAAALAAAATAGVIPAARADPSVVPAETAAGYAQAVAEARRRAGFAFAVPTRIPRSGGPLHAYAMPLFGAGDTIVSFDHSADCHGARYCSAGSFSVSRRPIAHERDRTGQPITRSLADGLFFTPEHAMADSFPAQVQWQSGGLTYTMAWSQLAPGEAPAVLGAIARTVTPP